MSALALAWWATLAFDALQGRVAWWLVALAGAVLLLWGVSTFRWVKGLRRQSARRLYWQAAGQVCGRGTVSGASLRWADESGNPVVLRVKADLGFGTLVHLATHRTAGRVEAQWRWIDEPSMRGPWRWRVMSSSGREGLVPADEQVGVPMVASLARCESRKIVLPATARRSA